MIHHIWNQKVTLKEIHALGATPRFMGTAEFRCEQCGTLVFVDAGRSRASVYGPIRYYYDSAGATFKNPEVEYIDCKEVRLSRLLK